MSDWDFFVQSLRVGMKAASLVVLIGLLYLAMCAVVSWWRKK